MGSLFEWITDWIKEGLIDAITGQYTSIFNSVNNQVADVANQVGQTPQGWNGGVFSMIQNLSETVVIPIAGMILTFVLVYGHHSHRPCHLWRGSQKSFAGFAEPQ